MSLTLVTGGVRSGKSAVAEKIIAGMPGPVTYVATATDDETGMAERISRHRARRPADWQTVKAADLTTFFNGDQQMNYLLDGLGVWLAGAMERIGLFEPELLPDRRRAHTATLLDEVRELARTAAARPGLTVIVAEQAGLGLLPGADGSRLYLDLLGEATELLVQFSSQALFVVAGQPLSLLEQSPAGGRFRTDNIQPDVDRVQMAVHGDTQAEPGMLDFAVNVVADRMPIWLRNELGVGLKAVGRYPDDRRARAAVAALHGRDSLEVMVLNGATEAFWLLASALRPSHAVCVHPSFTEPELALRAFDIPVERVLRGAGFQLDAESVPASADFVVVGNPNNPTGTLDASQTIAKLARPGRTLVVDEAFMDFVPGQAESLARNGDLPGLVVVRSLTKIWSLAGVRAGYMLAPAETIAAVESVRPPWAANSLACAAVEACCAHNADTTVAAEQIGTQRRKLLNELQAIPGLKTLDSAANFLLLRVGDGTQVVESLRNRGIAVRPAGNFPGLDDSYIRVAVRDESANTQLVAALREAIDQC